MNFIFKASCQVFTVLYNKEFIFVFESNVVFALEIDLVNKSDISHWITFTDVDLFAGG